MEGAAGGKGPVGEVRHMSLAVENGDGYGDVGGAACGSMAGRVGSTREVFASLANWRGCGLGQGYRDSVRI